MARASQLRSLWIHSDVSGNEPLTRWLNSLKDASTRRRIEQRIARMELGNFGDYSSVGDGVMEMRLHFGSGYRVYFAEKGNRIVILLCGGDKSTQKKDVKRARSIWKTYKEAT